MMNVQYLHFNEKYSSFMFCNFLHFSLIILLILSTYVYTLFVLFPKSLQVQEYDLAAHQ